jgi:pimeloyl-ACP methyl ester carboxylesterase
MRLIAVSRTQMPKLLIRFAAAFAILAVIFWIGIRPSIPKSVLQARYDPDPDPAHYILLPGNIRAHVKDRGPHRGPTLVLLHGSFDSMVTWEPWAERLTGSLRVVTIDLPGHGLTGAIPPGDSPNADPYSEEAMVRFVAQVADALSLHGFALAGNSMGGRFAARFAEEYPGRLTHLILVDAGGLGKPGAPLVEFTFSTLARPFFSRPLLAIAPRWVFTELAKQAISRGAVMTSARIDALWDFNHMEGTREATVLRFAAARSAVKDHLADIITPTLILWGNEDRLVPVEAAREYHAAILNSRLVVYRGVGHMPQEEVPDESAAEVRAFLVRQ